MSIARAQFKLPSNNRSIIDVGDFYYFGGYLAGKDMKPVSFDRVLPATVNAGISATYSPLSLTGSGSNLSMDISGGESGVVSAQALTFAGGIDPKFQSVSGVTAGKTFVMSNSGVLSEVRANSELDPRCTISSALDVSVRGSIDYCVIVDENINYFFAISYSRYSGSGSSAYAQRLAIVRISKADFSLAILTGASGSTSSVIPGAAHLNKAARYLGKQADGKHLFVVYRTSYGSATIGTTGYWYMTLDPTTTAGTMSYSASATTFDGPPVCYSYSVPSNLVAASDENVLGYWFNARQNGDDDVTIVRRSVPSLFAGTAPLVPRTGDSDYSECTILNMPEGVILPTPGVVMTSPSNVGEIALWTVRDAGVDYLIYFAHNGGQAAQEGNALVPVSRHVMFVFEINEEGNTLTYRSHIADGFGYGQHLRGIALSSDSKTCIVSSTNGFGILAWSSSQKSYAVSPWRAVTGVARIHFDRASQIWVENTFGEVFVFNPELSSSVVVSFQDNTTSVLYAGTTITLDSLINVYNFIGERISRTVRLQARGCTFSDGLSTRDITTSATADTVEKIYINGQGNVTVDAFLL